LASQIGRRNAEQEFKWMKQEYSVSSGVGSKKFDTATMDAISNMLKRRISGEPLQYILGTQPFGSLCLQVRPPVLIPRPETENWTLRLSDLIKTEFLQSEYRRPISLLDLGTGTGCIPLLLCNTLPLGTLRAHGIDVSQDALALATENAEHCGFSVTTKEHKAMNNTFIARKGNILSGDVLHAEFLPPPFDVITSNPPYIPWGEFLALDRSVCEHEDARALFGGPDGLEFYEAIERLIAERELLKQGGILALEVGHNQANAVVDLMSKVGLRDVETWRDPWGKSRTVVARG
ncbi:S-adenosyl-L-methionine-dependent methyltransferase, partial [Fistulina hepatica ATCC 64428]